MVEATKSHLNDPKLLLSYEKREEPRTQSQMMTHYSPFPAKMIAKKTRITPPEIFKTRTASRKTNPAISLLSRYPELLRPDIIRVSANDSQSSHDSSFDISRGEAPNLDRSMSSSQAFRFGSSAYTEPHAVLHDYRRGMAGRSSRRARNILEEYAKILQELEGILLPRQHA